MPHEEVKTHKAVSSDGGTLNSNSEFHQKNEQIKKDNLYYQKLSKLLDEIDVNTNVLKRGIHQNKEQK